ncbi:hypothetical protein K1718_12235 [Roseibium porphyridii]|uniref:Uncharacterized protein n=1 Tax=Roseibium porphyridii TaxID=2866279 RepID=A0ABY8F9C1_9HYPH|nr:hypothetical protein [Roseibium sp. KMA01]WFE92095.1 hypothetical protein K1718_12235 [Roseibium sp. KMA01]
MNSLKALFAIILILGSAKAVSSQEVGESEFVYVSDLASTGYEPFAVSSTASASFGMKKGATMYLCFLADNDARSLKRREVIRKTFEDENAPRILPSIPVVCVLAQ